MMSAQDQAAVLRTNVIKVKSLVDQAIQDAIGNGMRGSDQPVRVIAVSKYVDARLTGWLAAEGCRDLGESRPQTLWQKHAALAEADAKIQAEPIRWHMIGHLQRNKVGRTLPLIDCLHSLDSLRLAETVNAEALKQGLVCRALVEVNPTEDSTKTGLPAADAARLLESLRSMPGIRVEGLMAMSSLEAPPQQSLEEFQRVRDLRDQLQQQFRGEFQLQELSMGMSGDFREGILAGATMVRIGSLFWEGIL